MDNKLLLLFTAIEQSLRFFERFCFLYDSSMQLALGDLAGAWEAVLCWRSY